MKELTVVFVDEYGNQGNKQFKAGSFEVDSNGFLKIFGKDTAYPIAVFHPSCWRSCS